MEKTTNQKIKLGIFVIIGSLFFIIAIYFIGNKKDMFNETIQISAVFKNVNGLQHGNNVRFSGINVGTVKKIIIVNDSLIKVDMLIEEDIASHIKKDAMASIGSDGLVGNMIVNIIPGKKSNEMVKDGDVILSENKASTDEILKTINSTSENAKLITDNLVKITNQINSKKGTIGMLINDTVMSDDLKQTIYNLKVTTQSTSKSMANLNKIINDLNNKDNVVGALKDTVTGRKIKMIIVNLEKSSEQINKTITNLKDGKGALNYLSNDPKLVKQIDSTMINLNQASSKLNENLEALKHNFFFRGYFKKQEKAKAKAAKK
ncbi:MlaD family protein [Flavobacterium sp.]|jgi:phospholipid/cholesterol/gamma-HCH transport system substrate-binding protein|uniref:MlaD family protein n=1 Tax=Flavobacterium sp. TaxID=239 RepID=UPI0037C1056E